MSLSPYSFRMGSEFLAREELENMMSLAFSGLSLILHLAHHFAIFCRSLRKNVLLQFVHFYWQPIEQCHQQTGISSFVCGEVLVSH